MTKRIENTAYHEAGHAVAFYLTDRRFEYVSIKPDRKSSEDHIVLGSVMQSEETSSFEWGSM